MYIFKQVHQDEILTSPDVLKEGSGQILQTMSHVLRYDII